MALLIVDALSSGVHAWRRLTGLGRRRLFELRVQQLRADIVQPFMKRLRKNSRAKIRYICVAEMHSGGGQLHGRPHFHLGLHSVPGKPAVRRKHVRGAWKGHRAGLDYRSIYGAGAAWYITKYLTKETASVLSASKYYGRKAPSKAVWSDCSSVLGAGVKSSSRHSILKECVDETTPKKTIANTDLPIYGVADCGVLCSGTDLAGRDARIPERRIDLGERTCGGDFQGQPQDFAWEDVALKQRLPWSAATRALLPLDGGAGRRALSRVKSEPRGVPPPPF